MFELMDPNAISTAAAIVAAVPDPAPVRPPGFEGVDNFIGAVRWGGLAVAVVGMIVAGALMTIANRRGESGDHLGRIAQVMVGVIIIAGAGSLIAWLA